MYGVLHYCWGQFQIRNSKASSLVSASQPQLVDRGIQLLQFKGGPWGVEVGSLAKNGWTENINFLQFNPNPVHPQVLHNFWNSIASVHMHVPFFIILCAIISFSVNSCIIHSSFSVNLFNTFRIHRSTHVQNASKTNKTCSASVGSLGSPGSRGGFAQQVDKWVPFQRLWKQACDKPQALKENFWRNFGFWKKALGRPRVGIRRVWETWGVEVIISLGMVYAQGLRTGFHDSKM